MLLIQAEGGMTSTSTGARIAGLFSPFTILDGVRIWLGGTTHRRRTPNPGHFGPLYGAGHPDCSRPASGAWPRATGR